MLINLRLEDDAYIVLVTPSCLHVAAVNKLRIKLCFSEQNQPLLIISPLPASGLESVALNLLEFQNHTWVQSQ